MVEKHSRVVLLKLLYEPPPLLDGHVVTECHMLKELFQALEGVLLSLLLILLCGHLLTKGEHYTAAETDRQTYTQNMFNAHVQSGEHGQAM